MSSPVERERGVASSAPQLERYELLDEIARGGMGVVYRARDRSTGEVRALKCVQVSPTLSHRHMIIESFEREYQVLRGLKHPRIIQVFDYGLIEGGAFYTMELLEGQDLRRCAPIPWQKVCQYLRDIATCLSLLHARRLIHRDLSPSNVKLTGDGHCKLLDFGALVEFGQVEMVVGTPPFIAPEMLAQGRLDQRVDLYALGALGYYCLTGRHAYPADRIEHLTQVWMREPALPSQYDAQIPSALDTLIMALLREDPLARPSSAAEVITRLDAITDLPAEDEGAQRTLIQSFVVAPRYVGRERELQLLEQHMGVALSGEGHAVRVEAPAGAGRSRLLDEVAIYAQLAGCLVVRADASAHRERYGVARALAHSLSSVSPKAGRLPVDGSDVGPGIEQKLVEVSRQHALVVLVDNVEDADDASLGSLIALARMVHDDRVLLVLVEQQEHGKQTQFGFAPLRAACETMTLANLTREEVAELLRSLFGEAQRIQRLAEWLHTLTAGSPLHCLGLIRRWSAEGSIRYERGVWVLPSSLPDSEVSEVLEDTLAHRLKLLSVEALELAQGLSLSRLDLTVALCRHFARQQKRPVPELLEELAAADVLRRDQDRFSFSSAALRRAAVKRMDASARRLAHLRLGKALAETAGEQDLAQQIEAGWHLIRGGEELRGADMIAHATRDSVACNLLVANLYQIGAPVEAALKVYRSSRRSKRERMPLLSTLAQAGYYEHHRWADSYGDDALDVAEELSGLGLARRLTPFLGAYLAFMFAVGLALLRHYRAPAKMRNGSFFNLLEHVCCTVTALSGIAAISLDADRCDRVAEMLAPSRVLPKRMALVGVYKFCTGLQHIAREHQAEAFACFDELAALFSDPKYFWFLPPQAQLVYRTACYFARGSFGMMRADGAAAIESALVLEQSQLPLYVMIASQIRYLYHLNRGELQAAQEHRSKVELHAARMGSAWQVELWEPASLLPFYIASDDVVELSRIAHRLGALAETTPSMWRYRELANLAADLHKRDALDVRFWPVFSEAEPRSFIGWSTALAGAALFYNQRGEHAEARALIERALVLMDDEDRQSVMIFLLVDLQAALADAGLGKTEEALARLDHLLALHKDVDHALTLGLTHEMRARIAIAADQRAIYEESLREATRWLRATGTPTLVARCERLEQLGNDSTPATLPAAGDFIATGTMLTVDKKGATSSSFRRE